LNNNHYIIYKTFEWGGDKSYSKIYIYKNLYWSYKN
jgi:hypothetical protein